MTQNQRTLITSSILVLGVGLIPYILYSPSISESFPLVLQFLPYPAVIFVVHDQSERGLQNPFIRFWMPFICSLLPVLLFGALSSKVPEPKFQIEPNFTKEQFDALWNVYLQLSNKYQEHMSRYRSMIPVLSLIGVAVYGLFSRFALHPISAKGSGSDL